MVHAFIVTFSTILAFFGLAVLELKSSTSHDLPS